MRKIYHELVRRGTGLGAGCSSEKLSSFQQSRGVVFPEQFLELWSMVNGTAPIRGSYVSLWSLDEIAPVEESPFGGKVGAQMWIIADYMAGTHGYGLSLDPNTWGGVYLIDGERVEKVADDLEQFVLQSVLT